MKSSSLTTALLAFSAATKTTHRVVLAVPKSVLSAEKAEDAFVIEETEGEIVAPFIYGGEDAQPGEFPYYVQLPSCGGALIARDFVLSAAHCPDITGSYVIVAAYKRSKLEEGALLRRCTRWIPHPEYDGTQNDVALCKLDVPIGENELDFSGVKLELDRPEEASHEFSDRDLVAVGMGKLDGQGNLPSVLQKTTLKGISDDECKVAVERYGMPYFDSLVCADGEGETDVCGGDSGGPLVLVTEGDGEGPAVHRHVGSVSYGTKCPIAAVGVYAKTSAMVSWIDTILCQESSIDAPTNCDDDDESSSVPSLAPTFGEISSSDPSFAPTFVEISSSVPSLAPTFDEISSSDPSLAPTFDEISSSDPSFAPTFVEISSSDPSLAPTFDEISSSDPSLAPTFGEISSSVPSFAPMPNDDDLLGECENDHENENERSELIVSVTTDQFPLETRWVLQKKKKRKTWETLMERNFMGREPFTEYYDTLCLEGGSSYKWIILDSGGDGLCYNGQDCGSFSLTLNGLTFFARSKGDFSEMASKIFKTPGDDGGSGDACDADPKGKFNVRLRKNKTVKKTCRWLDKQIQKKGSTRGKKLCLKDSDDTLKVMEVCKKTCGLVGLGQCASDAQESIII